MCEDKRVESDAGLMSPQANRNRQRFETATREDTTMKTAVRLPRWTLDAMVWRKGRFVAVINGCPYDRAQDWAIRI